MKRDFFGDSYDAVKRMWCEILSGWARLYAEPRFIPTELHQAFTRLTGIPMLADYRPETYSILNDPDTGIRLPNERTQGTSRKHIAITAIANQLQSNGVRCVVTFDQSFIRSRNLTPIDQRHSKMDRLRKEGFPSFYYVSHAPFLFAAPDEETLEELRTLLVNAGIPNDKRLENLK
ncbi:MAG TPA: hypothetical protein VL171_07675 [Verrucomicrobiae bacterium]|nr:hypothetical protein [Verrucomicrobiae bacterium]